MVTLRPLTSGLVKRRRDALANLADLAAERRRVVAELDALIVVNIAAARSADPLADRIGDPDLQPTTWETIGAALGISKQSAVEWYRRHTQGGHPAR